MNDHCQPLRSTNTQFELKGGEKRRVKPPLNLKKKPPQSTSSRTQLKSPRSSSKRTTTSNNGRGRVNLEAKSREVQSLLPQPTIES